MHRNVRPKLASVRKVNKELGNCILADIEAIQWMCQSSAEFQVNSKILIEYFLFLYIVMSAFSDHSLAY